MAQSPTIFAIAQEFLTTEDFFTVYDTLDTLLDDLSEALGRKKKGRSVAIC